MRMRKFEFSSPFSMAEALKLLAQNGSRVKVIAAGMDLVEPIVEALKKVYQEKFLSILFLFPSNRLGDFWRIGEAPKDAGVIA